MGQNVHACRGSQRRREIRIDLICDLRGGQLSIVQRFQNLPLPAPPVRHQMIHHAQTVGMLCSMTRKQFALAARNQFLQRGKIVRHVAGRRRDNGRSPSHDVVSGKKYARFADIEAKVISKVAGRPDRIDFPIINPDFFAVLDANVGFEEFIHPLFEWAARKVRADQVIIVPSSSIVSESTYLGSGLFRESGRHFGMVQVRMRQ